MKNFTEINEGVLSDMEGTLKRGDDITKANELFNMLKILQLYNCGKYNDPGDTCIGDSSVTHMRQTRHGSQKDMLGHKLTIGDLVFIRKNAYCNMDYCYGIIIGTGISNEDKEGFKVVCGINGYMRDPEARGKFEDLSISDMNKMRDNFELTPDSVYRYASIATIPGRELIHIVSKNKVAAAISKLK